MSSSPSSRLALLTGATGSIGKEIARGLAKHKFTVILTTRNIKKTQQLIEELEKDSIQSSQFIIEEVDLSSKASITQLCERIVKQYRKLDVLVNNGAVVPTEREETKDGIEAQFGVNVLSYHWLSKLLHPALKAAGSASSPSRIVNVASRYAGSLDMNDLEFKKRSYNADTAYKASKQANRMLSWESARRWESDHINVNAVYPGFTGSALASALNFHSPPDSAVDSADTPVYAATAPELNKVTGKWIVKRKVENCEWAYDVNGQRRLWELCEQY